MYCSVRIISLFFLLFYSLVRAPFSATQKKLNLIPTVKLTYVNMAVSSLWVVSCPWLVTKKRFPNWLNIRALKNLKHTQLSVAVESESPQWIPGVNYFNTSSSCGPVNIGIFAFQEFQLGIVLYLSKCLTISGEFLVVITGEERATMCSVLKPGMLLNTENWTGQPPQ